MSYPVEVLVAKMLIRVSLEGPAPFSALPLFFEDPFVIIAVFFLDFFTARSPHSPFDAY